MPVCYVRSPLVCGFLRFSGLDRLVILRLHPALQPGALHWRWLANQENAMRLRHIEVFNAVMLTGSVTGAARLINVTQPAVSRLLQHAELQLGFALFQRSKGRLTATPEALALYPHIERLFAQLDEVQRLAANLKAGSGARELRVLTVLALSYEILPQAIRRFRLKHPAVPIAVQALHSPDIVSALALQEADVGFLFSPLAHPALAQLPLAQGRMVCIAPRGMLPADLVAGKKAALTDLAPYPVIGLDIADPIGRSLSLACREADVGLQFGITVQTYHSALALAHHGLGIAIVETCTAASADLSRVDVLALEPFISVPVTALLPLGRPASVAVQAFVRCFEHSLAASMGSAGSGPSTSVSLSAGSTAPNH